MSSRVIQRRTKPNEYGESKVYLRYQLKRGETQGAYKEKVAKARKAIELRHKIVGTGQRPYEGGWYWAIKKR